MSIATTLVLNVGSSSLKATVLRGQRILAAWEWEERTHLVTGGKKQKSVPALTMTAAATSVLAQAQLFPLTRIAHRVVHGGPTLWRPTKITPQVLRTLKTVIPLAPLHLPNSLRVIREALRAVPGVTHWAVFDTGLFHHLPAVARDYALPAALTKKYAIRHYGFHGTSHLWAATATAKAAHVTFSRWSGVTVHLGSGSSVAVWKTGRPIDTSMGFSPISGPLMATRSGDLDPMLPLYIAQRAHLTPAAVTILLAKKSGLLGLTGSADIRDILASLGHPVHHWKPQYTVPKKLAAAAYHTFTYEVAKIIGEYASLLPTPPSVAFTGTIGQNKGIQRDILRWLPAARRWKTYTIRTNESVAIVEILDGVLRYPK